MSQVPTNFIGGWLTGRQIISEVVGGRITIEPFDLERVNPNSYNYTLGARLLRLVTPVLDMCGREEYEEIEIAPNGCLLLPSECYLGTTQERFGSDCFASLVTGRSSVGRKFVTNHITAGLIDVGFVGQITLEITVQRPIRVYQGIPFGQIFWFSLYGFPSLYSGKYQLQSGATPSRLSDDFSDSAYQVQLPAIQDEDV
jgi:dCTP deaminase